MMDITLCTFDDIESIVQISTDRILETTLRYRNLETYLSNSNYRVYKYVLQEPTILGYCIIRMEGEEVEIDEIAIDKGYEGRGYATYFLKAIFTFLKRAKVKKVFLEVRSKNVRAIRLYERLGFQHYRTRKNYYYNDDALCYVKELNYEE